jgi:hypothetical protein
LKAKIKFNSTHTTPIAAMTLLKDLITIPEQVQKGDFVLKLSEGVNQAEATVRDYVVTPELQGCFDNALNFIKSALEGNTSKATYLHGSFGSGKSHFMAVLHLILQGNIQAKSLPDLASVIAKHSAWINGKRFLLVPYHAIGASSMEACILGSYADHLRTIHPEAPIPGIYKAEGLFKDAQTLRQTMGDTAFFASFQAQDGWGDVGDGWTPARFETAIAAEQGSSLRAQLISDLVKTYFKSYQQQTDNNSEAFVSLDKGLAALSHHAKNLGYDGLILFLDELILWLASRAAELSFVHKEGQKLAKLVEAQSSDRPIPIISFVARQRDLSELIGDAVPGAERLNFSDALKHWEGRFHRITLEDRNLPAIAQKRILRCQNDAARQELDAAFAQTQSIRETVMNILLTADGDRALFRQVYPFSLALVQTLIAVSNLLQRERTALKIMMLLLVEKRETLQVGDIIPVGDLFDVIADGDEAFSPEMATPFKNAQRLYQQKLSPLLERQHNLRVEQVGTLPPDAPEVLNFKSDDRLIKTLLLSALVPGVESLRHLTPERLAALNHGTIKSPIPGREGQMVTSKCRQWAAEVGEIRLSDHANPTISVELVGIDTEGILRQAEGIDNMGNRGRLLRDMLVRQLGLKEDGQLNTEQIYEFLWRGSKRECTFVFANIRELPDASLETNGDRWRMIIDYPFDEDNRSPKDDLSKIQLFKTNHPDGSKTLCWIPAFFGAAAEKDLGKLVVLEHVLAGERFDTYCQHLSPQDRQAAKSILESQQSALRQRIHQHLDAVYGLDAVSSQSIDTHHSLDLPERFISLDPGLELQPPVAPNFKGAFEHLFAQALQYEFPAAPPIEIELKPNVLDKVYPLLREATQAADGRVAVDKALRPLMRQIVHPLNLGEMGADATHCVLSSHWKTHFHRQLTEPDAKLTVAQLRDWINQPSPLGLPLEAENLIILLYAESTNRVFYRHALPHTRVSLKDLPHDCELKSQPLPDEAPWQTAVRLANEVFGLSISSLLNLNNVADLTSQVQNHAQALLSDAQAYYQSLGDRLEQWSLSPDGDRLTTATALLELLQCLSAKNADVVSTLADTTFQTSEAAVKQLLTQLPSLNQAFQQTKWDIFAGIRQLQDSRQAQAQAILTQVGHALAQDDYVASLGLILQETEAQAIRLLTQAPSSPIPETPPRIPSITSPAVESVETVSPLAMPGTEIPSVEVNTNQRTESVTFDTLDALEAQLHTLKTAIAPDQKVRFTLTWTLES